MGPPPVIAPLKCSLLPLSNNPDFAPIVSQLSQSLTQADISHRVDDSSGSIGKRYARTDEVAVPYGITVDFDSLKAPHSVTLRERDSTTQIRIGVTEVAEVVRQLATGRTDWQQVTQKFPKFEAQETKSVATPSTTESPMYPVGTPREREILEAHLQTRSYIKGFTIGEEDYKQARALASLNQTSTSNMITCILRVKPLEETIWQLWKRTQGDGGPTSSPTCD